MYRLFESQKLHRVKYLKFNAFLRTACNLRDSLNVRLPFVSTDGTHHIGSDFKPVYDARFQSVLSFHSPENLAAVKDFRGFAYHIDIHGHPAYSQRFNHTFGFYERMAAVRDSFNQWSHIYVNGESVYAEKYAWCGNFTRLPVNDYNAAAMAPVRSLKDGTYFHISETGKVLGGPYLYAGDPNSQGQSVVWDVSTKHCSIVNADRSVWGVNNSHPRLLFDARAPHKGIAAVKDDKGWFFIDNNGEQVGKGRYQEVESHYNGHARVRLLSGEWAIVDQQGEVVVNLGQSMAEMQHDLVSMSQKYWPAVAIRKIVDTQVLADLPGAPAGTAVVPRSKVDPKLKEILLSVSTEMGLCASQLGQDGLHLTAKGQLLCPESNADTITRDKVDYWLQDRYFKAWLPHLKTTCKSANMFPDTFREISADPEAVNLSQRVLQSYAQQDWKGITSSLPINELLSCKSDTTSSFVVADIAGGTGVLLQEVASALPDNAAVNLVCVERPEVVQLASQQPIGSKIQFVALDLFNGSLPSADVYLLSRVLHDWDDMRAEEILRRIHQYSPAHATLCVIDRHATPDNMHSLLSLHMYMLQKSFERTSHQWSQLFEKSGWTVTDQKPFNGHEVVTLRKSPYFALPFAVSDLPLAVNIARNTAMAKNSYDVRKAVVPIAGLGTRMAPQSSVTPKALLPILTSDHNNSIQVQPALTHLLAQLLSPATGIVQVCIVAAPNQLQILKQYLGTLDTVMSSKISVFVQESALGLGDAILRAKTFVGDEPFLVALGDHVFTPNCVQQLVNAYRTLVTSVGSFVHGNVGLTGACLCTKEEIPLTGLLQLAGSKGGGGNDLPNTGEVTAVVNMAEKPKHFAEYALNNTQTGETKYLSQLGLDILPPSIFVELSKQSELQLQQGREVGLRPAMKDLLLENGNLYSFLVDGTRLDIGTPEVYWNTLQTAFHSLPPAVTDVTPREVASLAAVNVSASRSVPTTEFLSCSDNDESVITGLLTWLERISEPHAHNTRHATHISSSPGRIDLMGGFADYSGSRVLQQSTATRCYAIVTLTSEHSNLELRSVQVASVNDIVANTKSGSSFMAHPSKVRKMTIPSEVLWSKKEPVPQLVSKEQLRASLTCLLTSTTEGSWPKYIVGVIHAAVEQSVAHGGRTFGPPGNPLGLPSGINITVVSDVPWNTGLASSAAVEMATAYSAGHALGLPSAAMQPVPMALMCQAVENHVVGANCGLMDHLAVGHAPETHHYNELLSFSCRLPLAKPVTVTVRLPEGLSVVAVESGVVRSVADPPYKQVRVASLMGRYLINKHASNSSREIDHLCEVPLETFYSKYQDMLPELLTGQQFLAAGAVDNIADIDRTYQYRVKSATAHPIEENYRVKMFETLLDELHKSHSSAARDRIHRDLGDLMLQSHLSYTKCGLGTAETDLLTSLLHKQTVSASSKVVGAKLSGGGGGGAISMLLWDAKKSSRTTQLEDTPFWRSLQKKYQNETGLTCTLRSGTSSCARYHGVSKRFFSGCSSSSCRGSSNSYKSQKPNILMVNHGYPPIFNGGSEVYTQTLALQMLKSGLCGGVNVMAREHDPFRPDFEMRLTSDKDDPSLPVYLVNYPREAGYYQFQSDYIDQAFRELLRKLKPDLVHFHHLNHLSLNLPLIAKEEGIAKVVYTLHDYWLMCPRGQFLITGTTAPDRSEPWQQCDGQGDRKCATNCYTNRYSTGDKDYKQSEVEYWTEWIGRRMNAVRATCDSVDAFVAPSRYLHQKFVKQFHLPEYKVLFLPYGFDRVRLSNRQRARSDSEPYVFAYIGRHVPAKGINLLVSAALKLITDDPALVGKFVVRIYGRADLNSTTALERLMEEDLPDGIVNRTVFQWHKEYNNFDIVSEVFNHVDTIVVPSIWEENSPLVIHEAQQCGVPVITSEIGGMGELVHNEVNGLTFKHRRSDSLAAAMLKALRQPEKMAVLGRRGYLFSEDGEIPCVIEHGKEMLRLYDRLLHANLSEADSANSEVLSRSVGKSYMNGARRASIVPLPAPWRITFDTNPDDCNFSCTMCEQHSEHSPHQKERKAKGIRRRRMSIDLIRKTMNEMAPLGLKEAIPTTMGEPLMYKHFPQFIEACKQNNVKMNLTTNGSFYGREGAVKKWAELVVPVTSDVKISWNGITKVTQEKIMKNSDLDTQIANLKEFIAIRDRIAAEGGNYCATTLQLTFMEQNLDEIPAIVAFAIENGCDRVKGHHLWAHFAEIRGENLRRSEKSILRWNAVAKQCREYVVAHPLRNGKTLRLDNFFDLELSAAADNDSNNTSPIHPDAVCPFLGKEAWINHEGRFDPCCAPDEQRKSLGYFGNINNPGESLLEIWRSEKYQELCRTYLSKPLCRGCNMRRPPN